ncbi:MAG: Fic family protein [Sporolactobacillus sp.]
MMELMKMPIFTVQWDLAYLQAIHHYIFQDVYPFAGKIRTEQIGKGHFRFASPLYIEGAASDLFQTLRHEHFLKNLGREAFCDRLTYYFTEINVLHPFREGNGRTEREFLRTLALKNGYTLDFRKISQAVLLQASERSVADAKALLPILQQAILEDSPNPACLRQWELFSTKTPYELPEHLKRQGKAQKGHGFER